MGTRYHVKYVTDGSVNSVLVADAVLSALRSVDYRMSTYNPDSELMQFNNSDVGDSVTVSSELALLLGRSLELSRISGGAFDVTVGPLVNIWGFGPGFRPEQVPSDQELAEAFAKVGYQALQLENDQLIKTRPLFVDLSAIAKGYAVDKVADALEAMGISNYLIEVGGELRVGGTKANGQDWLIGIEQPDSVVREARLAIRAPGQAIATSGDYRNYFEKDGIRYSHTIDPTTGRPVTNRLASVTVVAPECMDADAWATMLMVLGEKKGLALAQQEGVAAYFIYHGEEGFDAVYSDGFAPYLTEQSQL